jgi:hypothetical protein
MTPAWKSWPIEPGADVTLWHGSTCAMCGKEGRTVIDHCHLTGLVRGNLCTSCNKAEATSDRDWWLAWRAWDNPARALNSAVLYEWGRFDRTPLHSESDLEYMLDEERDEWWAEQLLAASEGRDWPTPVTIDLAPRRAAHFVELRAAMELGSAS